MTPAAAFLDRLLVSSSQPSSISREDFVRVGLAVLALAISQAVCHRAG